MGYKGKGDKGGEVTIPSFEDIKVGQELPPVHKKMTQEIINRWAEVSTDHNPLHVDPEYARTTRYGGTIAHGYIALAYLGQMMTQWLGDGWIRGGKLLEVRLLAPIRPGDEVTTKGVVKDKRIEGDTKLVECEVFIQNQEGVQVVAGRAIGRCP